MSMVHLPVYGTVVKSPTYPMYPLCTPPFYPAQDLAECSTCTLPTNFFNLCFVAGNISTCIGCRDKLVRSPAPHNLCIQHKEWRSFVSQSSGTPQTKFSNVHYHCQVECVWLRCPSFVPSELVVTTEIMDKLSQVHKEHLASAFGLQFWQNFSTIVITENIFTITLFSYHIIVVIYILLILPVHILKVKMHLDWFWLVLAGQM